ncbi:MAG: hypothetical protein HC796_10175 [Synechococcaceae cyanobacterium RL_1_2]|nr:hypothetical protein [Synechococcaceae cyanobacterium RL_1_2]
MIGQGAKLHNDREFNQAIDLYNQVLQIIPHHPVALSFRGLSYWSLGGYFDLIQAQQDFEEAIKHHPTHGAAQDYLTKLKAFIAQHNPLPAKFQPLAELLQGGKWQAADGETNRLLLRIANCDKKGYLTESDCQKFPLLELRIMDQLWLKASGGKFGFSVQKQIWLDCGGKFNKYDYHVACKFGDRVGWRKNDSWLSYSNLTFNTKALTGHLPSIWSDLSGFWISFLASRL